MKNRRISGVSKKTYKVYDENGNFKRTIEKAEEKVLKEEEWLKGVTCFVINEKGEALIEVRANKGLTPGKKDLCSGHLDNNETETQAMIRELREELGINLEEAIKVIKVTQKGIPLKFESKGKTKKLTAALPFLSRREKPRLIVTFFRHSRRFHSSAESLSSSRPVPGKNRRSAVRPPARDGTAP